jgi:hypothetical protein
LTSFCFLILTEPKALGLGPGFLGSFPPIAWIVHSARHGRLHLVEALSPEAEPGFRLRRSYRSGWMFPGAEEMAERKGWSRKFDDPIPLSGGGRLVTLRDAATFITGLPDGESALPEWQAAIEALMLVADLGGPTMFARMGMMRALNRHHVRESIRSEKTRIGGGAS